MITVDDDGDNNSLVTQITAQRFMQTVPYHLVFGLNPNSDTIFRASHNTATILDRLFVRTQESPTPTYDGDLTNSTVWSPSISGVFQININSLFRSVNNDWLIEDAIRFKKLVSGSYVSIMDSNDRRWGSNEDEADARVFTNHNTLCGTIYATPSDTFRFEMYGRAYNGQYIWLTLSEASFRISITKVA